MKTNEDLKVEKTFYKREKDVFGNVTIEAFSCFGERGWHDQWSKTYVVKRSEKIELQRLLGTLSSKQEDLLD